MMKPTAIALALGATLPLAAQAQSAADLQKQIEAMKAQIQALEAQVKKMEATQVSPEEFNRIKTKAEALEDQKEAEGFKGLTITGFADVPYVYNQAQKQGSFVFLNNFSGLALPDGAVAPDAPYTYFNSYLGIAGFSLLKELEGGTQWKLTIAPQKSAASNYNWPSIVHEASVSVPLTDLQTRFIAGQIPDWSGYEYTFAYQQKLITHNLLFDFTVPSYYVGAGLDITRGNLNLKALVANINTNAYKANMTAPGFTFRGDYSINEFSGFGFAGQFGKAPLFVDPSSLQTLTAFEVDAWYERGDWSLAGQVGYGAQNGAAFNGGNASWWGVSGLAAYKILPKLQGVVRADYLYNERNGGGTLNLAALCSSGDFSNDCLNGFGPGAQVQFDNDGAGFYAPIDPNKGTNRFALSLGLNYLYSQNVNFRLEYRYDYGNQPVFLVAPDGGYRKYNNVIAGSTVLSF
jgi:hypothetical protein